MQATFKESEFSNNKNMKRWYNLDCHLLHFFVKNWAKIKEIINSTILPGNEKKNPSVSAPLYSIVVK